MKALENQISLFDLINENNFNTKEDNRETKNILKASNKIDVIDDIDKIINLYSNSSNLIVKAAGFIVVLLDDEYSFYNKNGIKEFKSNKLDIFPNDEIITANIDFRLSDEQIKKAIEVSSNNPGSIIYKRKGDKNVIVKLIDGSCKFINNKLWVMDCKEINLNCEFTIIDNDYFNKKESCEIEVAADKYDDKKIEHIQENKYEIKVGDKGIYTIDGITEKCEIYSIYNFGETYNVITPRGGIMPLYYKLFKKMEG